MGDYKFSIIVPHYDGVISDETFIEGMDSIESQSFRNFEVLIYHDGPLNRSLPDLTKYTFDWKFTDTKSRFNDWGHSLRDLGIREATGDYIIHFNPDNILYADALFNIDKSISRINELAGGEVDIVLCPIHMEGMVRVNSDVNNGISLFRTNDKRDILVMDGYPPITSNIDCMQLVGKRSIWLDVGGWYNKEVVSDGLIYQKLCENHNFVYCGSIIGVHR